MGKSSKKVKNDRINTLRRQYDAFLEEDKKRRERNEYILGKLDKMRSSTALVPISTQVNNRVDTKPSNVYACPNNLRIKPEIYNSFIPYLERKHVEESTVLNEISKKYILIPKRRIPVENIYTDHIDTIDDKDWKSKYNILDDLKKQEKEGHSDIPLYPSNEVTVLTSDKDSEPKFDEKQSQNLDNNTNQFNIPVYNKNSELSNLNVLNINEQGKKGNNTAHFETPEIKSQDVEMNKVLFQTVITPSSAEQKPNKTEVIQNTKQTNDSIVETYQEKHDLDGNEKSKDSVNHPMQNIDNSAIIVENMKDEKETTEYVRQENVSESSYNEQNMSHIAPQVAGESYCNPVVTDVKQKQLSGVDFSEQNVSINSQIQPEVNEIRDKTSSEKIHDVKDVNLEDQIDTNQTTYDQPLHYETVQESTPMVLENTEHTGPVDHDSEINAFESEQKEMFYSEQTEGETYPYNQEDDATGEYTTDGYQQNDQYGYYEGQVQQDQAYATNINEHEESTERYDPHYVEQYEASYENQHPDSTVYENNSGYEQQQFQEGNYENQQFQNVVNYENQQENENLYQQENNEGEVLENVVATHDNQMYSQQVYNEHSDTQEVIEQELITEEGVTDHVPLNTIDFPEENEKETTNVMDVTNPVEHIPEPKLS